MAANLPFALASLARARCRYEYFEWLGTLSYIKGEVGMTTGHWYEHYVAFLEEQELDQYTDFHANLSSFLDGPGNIWRTDVACTSGDYSNCDEIKCAKFVTWQTSQIDTFELYQIEVEVNDKIEELGFKGSYNWIAEFGYADADASIEAATLQSLLTCVAVVMVLMIMLMDTGSAVCIFVCVLFVDMDLLGMAYFWNVKLSSISFSGLIMSIGLSIDYNIHIAHAFLDGKGGVAERTMHALNLMGPSVCKGGLTTFFGTAVLSFASSTVFRIFFKMCLGTVIYGILHGVVLMPVLLGWYEREARSLRGPLPLANSFFCARARAQVHHLVPEQGGGREGVGKGSDGALAPSGVGRGKRWANTHLYHIITGNWGGWEGEGYRYERTNSCFNHPHL
jgi:hypothetical protein